MDNASVTEMSSPKAVLIFSKVMDYRRQSGSRVAEILSIQVDNTNQDVFDHTAISARLLKCEPQFEHVIVGEERTPRCTKKRRALGVQCTLPARYFINRTRKIFFPCLSEMLFVSTSI